MKKEACFKDDRLIYFGTKMERKTHLHRIDTVLCFNKEMTSCYKMMEFSCSLRHKYVKMCIFISK